MFWVLICQSVKITFYSLVWFWYFDLIFYLLLLIWFDFWFSWFDNNETIPQTIVLHIQTENIRKKSFKVLNAVKNCRTLARRDLSSIVILVVLQWPKCHLPSIFSNFSIDYIYGVFLFISYFNGDGKGKTGNFELKDRGRNQTHMNINQLCFTLFSKISH